MKSVLTFEKRVQLVGWMKAMEKQGWGNLRGLGEIAEAASRELDLRLTGWNVRSTAIKMKIALPHGKSGRTECNYGLGTIFACECGRRYRLKVKPLAYKLKGHGEKA